MATPTHQQNGHVWGRAKGTHGRKNWLFAGSDAGAERAAIIYTVFGTCRLHDIYPWAYLQDILTKLADGWLHSRLDELLPPNWATARRHAADSNEPTDAIAIPA